MADALPEPDDAAAATALGRGSRWLCGLVGLLSSGTGVVAVFVSSNDVGSSVMLAIGTLFLVMATTGHPITSAKLGNNEIQLARRIKRDLQAVLEAAPPELQQDLAEAVLDTPLADQDPLRAYAQGVATSHSAITYEQFVRETLESFGFISQTSATDYRADVGTDIVGTYKGAAVLVEVKWTSGPLAAGRVVEAAARQLVAYARQHKPARLAGMLVVTNKPLRSSYSGRWLQQATIAPIVPVVWANDFDDDKLKEALNKLVDSSDSSTDVGSD